MRAFNRVLAALALSVTTIASQAATYTSTLPEFNGDGSLGTVTVGTFLFSIPGTETITGATIDGQFGNSSVSSTAVQDVFADGIAVASCPTTSSFCWTTGPEAWSFTFAPVDFGIFADGSVILTDNQTDCCVIRLGESTLTITTVGAIPEPETYAMMLAGLGLLGFVAGRRKQNLTAA